MNEEIKGALNEGETVLWQGKPEKFEAGDKTHSKSFTTKILIALLIAAALTVGYFFLVGASNIKPVVLIIVWVIAIYSIFAEKIGCAKVRKCEYFLTDRRCIITCDGTVTDFSYDGVKEYKFLKDDDGHTCLLVGVDTQNMKMPKWRLLPTEPVVKDIDTGEIKKAGLYAIDDPDGCRKVFADMVKKS